MTFSVSIECRGESHHCRCCSATTVRIRPGCATARRARRSVSSKSEAPPRNEQNCLGTATPAAVVVRLRSRLPLPAARTSAQLLFIALCLLAIEVGVRSERPPTASDLSIDSILFWRRVGHLDQMRAVNLLAGAFRYVDPSHRSRIDFHMPMTRIHAGGAIVLARFDDARALLFLIICISAGRDTGNTQHDRARDRA